MLSNNQLDKKNSSIEREFFENVITRFERLSAALPDTQETQAMRAKCLYQVANNYSYLGDNPRALDAYQRAIDLYRSLRDYSPEDPDLAAPYLDCIYEISNIKFRLEDIQEYNRLQDDVVIPLAEQLHRQFPDKYEITERLAYLYSYRSSRNTKNQKDHLNDLNRAIELIEKEVSRGGEKSSYCLSVMLTNRVRYFAELGDIDKVRSDANRVLKLEQQANRGGIQIQLADCHRCMGIALMKADQPEVASVALRKSISLLESLAGANPGSNYIREQLLFSYDQIQIALRKIDRAEEADRYQRLATSLKERDLAPGRESATIFRELAVRYAGVSQSDNAAGRKEESNAALDRAIRYGKKLLELISPAKLANTAEGKADLRRYAASCRAVAHAAEKLKRWPEAIEFTRRQLEFAQASLADKTRPDLDLTLQQIYGNWSLLISYSGANQSDLALAAWEETVRLMAWSDYTAIPNGSPEDLALYIPKLAAAGKTADAAIVLAPGLAERRAQLKTNPTSVDLRFSLRRAYRVLGLIHEKSNKYETALEDFDHVISIGTIPKEGPDFPTISERELIKNSLIGRAICLNMLNRQKEAENSWNASNELNKTMGDPMLLAIFLARIGHWKQAIEITEETLGTSNKGINYYNAACIYSVASASKSATKVTKEEFARRSITLLDKANDTRFFHELGQLENVNKDEDLNPLRDREDFKKLIAELEKTAPKK